MSLSEETLKAVEARAAEIVDMVYAVSEVQSGIRLDSKHPQVVAFNQGVETGMNAMAIALKEHLG